MIFNSHIFEIITSQKYYFRGAVSETLTLTDASGKSAGQIDTNASGVTTIALSLMPGIYTITGSVSQYTRTVVLDSAGTYNACPDGAIYWYGNFIKGSSFIGAAYRSIDETYGTSAVKAPVITVGTNSVTISTNGSSRCTSTAYLDNINLRAGTIDIEYGTTRITGGGRFKIFRDAVNLHSNTSYYNFPSEQDVSKTSVSINLNANITQHIGVELTTNASSSNSNIIIYSIVNNVTPGILVAGAANEVVTYTGASSGELTLGADGTIITTTLKNGTYTFTGSYSGYSRKVSITSDTNTVKVHPDGIVYWYGHFEPGFDAVGSNIATGAAAFKQDNYLYNDTAQGKYGSISFVSAVTKGSYNTLIFDCHCNTPSAAQASIGLSTSSSAGSQYNTNMVTNGYVRSDSQQRKIYTVDISQVSNTTAYYPKVHSYSNDVSCWAVWFANNPAIHGAANETITYSGASSGTITLNDSGYAFLASRLTPGEYTFVGNIGNYERKITVTDATDHIYVYPDGALYWYGNDCVTWNTKTINAYASSYHNSYEETSTSPAHYYAQIKAAGNQSSYSDCSLYFTTANTVDLSKYSKIKFKVDITAITLTPSNEKGIKLGYSSKNSFGASADLDSNITGYYSGTSLNGVYEVTSPKNSQYITVASYCDLAGCPNTQNSIAKMYAVWCE